MKPVRILLFLSVTLLLAPITLAGGAWYWIRLVYLSHRDGTSATAYEPPLVRWMLHHTGTRPDDATVKLLRELPATRGLAINLMLRPTLWAMRLSGYTLPLMAYPAQRPSTITSFIGHRTEFFDRALTDFFEEARPNQIPETMQFVSLGAGFDTRPYQRPVDASVRVFEVDLPRLQARKRAALARAGLAARHVTFVSTDLNQDTWFDDLLAAGFDPGQPTLYLWEGVVYYLEERAFRSALATIGQHAGPGTAVAFDYPSQDFIEGRGSLVRRLVMRYLQASGEPWLASLPTDAPAASHVETLLAPANLAILRYEPYGTQARDALPFGGVALAQSIGTG